MAGIPRAIVLKLSIMRYDVCTTILQKLTIKASEQRQRLNEISGLEGDALTDEIRAEAAALTDEYRDTETKLRAAVAADGDGSEVRATVEDSEQRERRELRGRVTLADYMGAAVTQGDAGAAVGAAAEYSAAMGCAGLVPITMLGQTAEDRAAAVADEHRAITPAPGDANVPHAHAPIVPALFDRSVAGFLGIEMPTVGTGIASYPVLSTSLTGGMKAEDADAAETAGAYTVTDADPRRLTGSFRIRKEDTAKLPNLEDSLRENLSMVLSDAFDKQAVEGDGTAPNLNGILQQLTDPSVPATGAETFDRYLAALASHIDGLFAVDEMGIRGLVGPETYRHMAASLRAGNAADQTFSQYWRSHGGGIRATRRIADAASNIQQAIIRRSNPAGDRVAVAPVWMGLELIRDIYSDAPKGQIVVTGCVLVGGVVLLRKAAFVQDSFRLA